MKKIMITNETFNKVDEKADAFHTTACDYVALWSYVNHDDNYTDFIMDVIIDAFGLDK